MRILKKLSILFVVAIVMLTACRNTIPTIIPPITTPPTVVEDESISKDEAALLASNYIDSISFSKVTGIANDLVYDYVGKLTNVDNIKTALSPDFVSEEAIDAIKTLIDNFSVLKSIIDNPASFLQHLYLLDCVPPLLKLAEKENMTQTAAFLKLFTYEKAPVEILSNIFEISNTINNDDKIASIIDEVSPKMVEVINPLLTSVTGTDDNNEYTLSVGEINNITANEIGRILKILLKINNANQTDELNLNISLPLTVTSTSMNSAVFKDNTQYSGAVTLTVDFTIGNFPISGDHDFCIHFTKVTAGSNGNLQVKAIATSPTHSLSFNNISVNMDAYVDYESANGTTIEPEGINKKQIKVDFYTGKVTFDPNTFNIATLFSINNEQGTVTYDSTTVDFKDVIALTDQGK